MKSSRCIICNGIVWNETLTTPDFSLLQCSQCHFIKTLRKGKFDFNDDQYTDPDEPRKQFETKRHIYEPAARDVIAALSPFISKTFRKNFLDVGCGLGWALKEAERLGYKAYGIDPSRTFVTGGKKYLKVKSTVASLQTFRTKEKFDVILLSHVVEHIDDLPSFLQKASTFLKPKGLLLIACPNIQSMMFDIYKERWYALAPGQHLWQFSPKTLSRLLENNGFLVRRILTTNLYHEATGLRKIFLAFILLFAPLVKRGDQLVCVAQVKR